MSFNLGNFSKKIGALFDSAGSSSSTTKSKAKYQAIRDGQLTSNCRVVIEGKVAPAASRFEIGLLCFSQIDDENVKNGDVALKLQIVPSGGYAILCSRINRHWSEDERTPRGRLPPPLLQTNKFKMVIAVEPTQFRIEVNDVTFVTYLHRHPPERVGLISHEGDFEVNQLYVQTPPSIGLAPHVSSSSNLLPECTHEPEDHVVANLSFPKLPLLLPIKAGLQVGTSLSLKAKLTGNRFDVNFYKGSDPYEDPTGAVGFHLEVHLTECSIVRNCFINGQWQQEERGDLQFFPFSGHNAFHMQIWAEGNRYKVGIDGHHILDFCHRITPLSLIDHLGVHGEIQIQQLQLFHPPL